MKQLKLIKQLLLISFLMLLASCGEDGGTDSDSGNTSSTSTLNIKMQLKAAIDLGINITQVTATVTKDSFSKTINLSVANDIATGSLTDLAIGNYTVAITIYDGTTEVGQGTGTATVAIDQTASTDITLNVYKGELTLTINVTTNNAKPTADSGTDQTVAINSTVTLNGTASNDQDTADSLSYTWAQTAGTTITLANATTATPSFTAPATTGTLTFALTVSDSKDSSTSSSVNINVINQNPIANGGSNQTVAKNATVTLDASQSTDPDGDNISYVWAQTSGTQVVLSSSTAQKPTFTTPAFGATLVFDLYVRDAKENTASRSTITVTVQNQAPIANAGATQNANQQAQITLNGTASTDPDQDSFSYQWRQISGTAVSLNSTTASQPTFNAPHLPDTLVFGLITNDGAINSVESTVTINVINQLPTANAGNDQTLAHNIQATLNANNSTDPDANPLSYVWQQTSGTAVTLNANNVASPTFTTPNNNTTLVFSLTVNDGYANSTTDQVTINLINRQPIANAGTDSTKNKNTPVTLNGTTSTDPDNDSITYVWVQTSGTTVSLTGANTSQASFTTPATAGTLVFALVVNDGQTNSVSDSVSVNTVNQQPVANASTSQSVNKNAQVTLNGTNSSDPDGETITYQWTQTAGNTVTLNDATLASPTFTALQTTETLTFTLIVNDQSENSAADSVNITILNKAPTANAGNNQTLAKNTQVTLTGTGTDPDGETITYVWAQTQGEQVTLNTSNPQQPTFTAPSTPQTLTFALTTNDATESSAPSTVNINVINQIPVANAGIEQTKPKKQTVTLDGTSSNDPDTADTLTYTWAQTAGTQITLNTPNSSTPSFTAPNAPTTITFSLVVNDGTDNSTTSTVTINVINQAPIANAGSYQSIKEGITTTLDGSASTDPDSDSITYQWTQVAGQTVTLSDATAQKPTFPMPNDSTRLEFELMVNDGDKSSVKVSVFIGLFEVADVSNVTKLFDTNNLGTTGSLNGSISDILVEGNTVYVAMHGDGFTIYDISNKSNIIKLGSINTISGGHLTKEGNTVVIGINDKIYIVNVSDSSAPSIINTFDKLGYFGFTISDILMVGGNLFVLDSSSVYIYDLTDVLNPILKSQISIVDAGLKKLALLSNTLFVSYNTNNTALKRGLNIYDITNTSALSLISSTRSDDSGFGATIGLSTTGVIDITIEGDYLYQVFASEGVEIVDISNPSAPVVVGTYIKKLAQNFSSVKILNNFLYLSQSSASNSEQGLHVLDITTKTDPKLIGRYTSSGGIGDLDVAGDYAFVGGGKDGISLDIIDVSKPIVFKYTSQYVETSGILKLNIKHSGNDIYLLGNDNFNEIVDVSNPTTPIKASNFLTRVAGQQVTPTKSIEVEGTTAFLGTSSQGVKVFDVSDKSLPVQINSLTTFDNSDASYIKKINNVMYVAGGNKFYAADFSNINSLNITGSVLDFFSVFQEFEIIGNRAYVAVQNQGIRKINITDTSAMVLMDSYYQFNGPTRVSGLVAKDNLLFLSSTLDFSHSGKDYSAGLVIMDTTNDSWNIVSNVAVPERATDVKLVGNIAYLSTNGKGTYVIDVADVENPKIIDWSFDADTISIDATADYLYSAYSNGFSLKKASVDSKIDSTQAVSGGIKYNLSWTVDRTNGAVEIKCLSKVGTCTVNSIDQTAKTAVVTHNIPTNANSHELVIVLGNYQYMQAIYSNVNCDETGTCVSQ